MRILSVVKKLEDSHTERVGYYLVWKIGHGFGIGLTLFSQREKINEETYCCGMSFLTAVKLIGELSKGQVTPDCAKYIIQDFFYSVLEI